MSFVGGGNLPVGIIMQADKAPAEREDETVAQPPIFLEYVAADNMFFDAASFATPWWPQSGNVMGWDGVDTHLLAMSAAHSAVWIGLGSNGRLAFAGVTRDQYGSPVGGCTVKCFRTSTDELVSSVLSDPNTGYFIATTPYGDAHYLVVHGTGVAGASVNTAIPA